MPAHVGERLPDDLHDVPGPRGEVRRDPLIHVYDGDHPGLLLEVLGQTTEGLIELAVGHDPG